MCGTACAISGRDLGVNALGTMAHSWVQLFDSEYEAFKAYAELYPDNCTLLVDTYNVLKSEFQMLLGFSEKWMLKTRRLELIAGTSHI